MNRRFQFRLRTLMIVVTAMALLSPFAVRLVRERRRRCRPGHIEGGRC